MDRRAFLAGLGCSVAASPLVTPMALAQAPGENRLIVIILRGAMDGMDAVRPVGDPLYAAMRPTLGQGGLPVGNFWALHPAFEPLVPLWQAGQMGAVQAVSTPYRDRRSHFDGQDILEAGGMEVPGRGADGWLNRLIARVPGIRAQEAYAVGNERLLLMEGAAPVSRWAPEARLVLSPQAERLLALVHEGDPLFEQAGGEAVRIAGDVDREAGGRAHERLADFVAGQLAADARIASFSMGGWDTHGRQGVYMPRALGRLAEVVLRLREGLGPVWDRTGVLCITEFGRTARENGTLGTDHGTGGAMLYFGGALNGGQVLGDWPGLDDLYADRDLMPGRDVRSVLGWVLAGLFGVNAGDLGAVFPGVDLGADPGIVV